MSPTSFTDAELSMLLTLATPIPQAHRGAFLAAVAAELTRYPERGDGLTFRVGAELQRVYLTAPTKLHTGKYRI